MKNSIIADNGNSLAGDTNCHQHYYPTYIDIVDQGGNVTWNDTTCPGKAAGGGAGASAGSTSSVPSPKPKPLQCKKGFKKETVKGKTKCVKMKKAHQHPKP